MVILSIVGVTWCLSAAVGRLVTIVGQVWSFEHIGMHSIGYYIHD